VSWNCECGAKFDRDMKQIHSHWCPMYISKYVEPEKIKEEKKVDNTGWPKIELIERLQKEAIKRK